MTRGLTIHSILVLALIAAAGCSKKPPPEPRLMIEKLVVGRLHTNCYVVWDERSRKAMVIDPGADAKRIHDFVRERGLDLEAIVQTHNHRDHTGHSRPLHKLTGVPVLLHPQQEVLAADRLVANLDGLKKTFVEDGARISLGSFFFEVLHTPGHSPGGICLHSDTGVLFSGDLLFSGAIGRTDLPGGDHVQIMRSIHERLSEIPDNTRVLPGHGPETSLGRERKR